MAFASKKDYYSALGRVVECLTHADFWPAIADFLRQICAFDEFAVFHYVWSDPPRRIFDCHPCPERDKLHGELLSAAYLIGPYYNRIVRTQADVGFYHIDEIAPDEFRESEYHRIYYRAKRATDEGMYYVPLAPGFSVGLLSERREPSLGFSTDELQGMRAVVPLVSESVRQRWTLVEAPSERTVPVGEQMVTALECFGRKVLSEREREIAELILRGHSSKSGARKLGISPETERVHRKRLYQKLDVSSQAELFWLFIQSVSYFQPTRQNDPLQAMLQARN